MTKTGIEVDGTYSKEYPQKYRYSIRWSVKMSTIFNSKINRTGTQYSYNKGIVTKKLTYRRKQCAIVQDETKYSAISRDYRTVR